MALEKIKTHRRIKHNYLKPNVHVRSNNMTQQVTSVFLKFQRQREPHQDTQSYFS